MAVRREGFAKRREALGYTQETLAQRMGIDRSTVARWERGVQKPLPWMRSSLAKALQVTPDGLVALLDETAPQRASAPTVVPGKTAALSDLDGPQVVNSIFATAQEWQIADRKVGGGALYPSVVHYLTCEVAPQLVSPTFGVPVPRLFAAAASITEIAGWMAHDSGEDRNARRYFDRAFRLAVAGDDRALAANACASMAHLAIELRQPHDALRITTEGLGHATATHGTLRLIARLHTMRARGLALIGDRTGCCNALEDAERVLAQADGEQPAQWIAGFDEASLASEAALCFLQLTELGEAERRAREVIRLRSGDRVRSRTFAQLTLASILVHAGRVDEAAAIGHEACDTTASLSSARVVHQLRALGGMMSLAPKSKQVSSFFTALASLSVASGEHNDAVASWPV
ncbi:helix-turn-helix domain-containing protein [Saccharothrix syringae]|uniref:XRE family transcriptional regulator n=1 Tax=Saccharothrix syringae TaxID=103733 RepID=A0A5Q0GWI4_SACSY|nr:helix-turn-helix transcriptional regulator [Saccharothrix syringae]QFZ18476.1 XRE family transcriptional regulator [Saccharothrix syringae]